MEQTYCHKYGHRLFSASLEHKNFSTIREFYSLAPPTSTAERSTCLASISHLILSPSQFRPWTVCKYDPCFEDAQFREYSLPEWMTSVPWVVFKNIQAVSLSLPHIVTRFDSDEPLDLHVELLTLSASPGLRIWVPKDISNSCKNGKSVSG